MNAKYLILAGVLGGLCSSAFGQAKSQPVGFVTLTVPAQSDARWGLPLERACEFSSTVSAVNTGTNVVTLNGATFTNDQWHNTVSYYAKFVTGTKEGLVALISDNNATSLTLSPQPGQDLTGVVAGDQVKIIPFWTPSTLFPAGAPDGTQLLFFQSAGATEIGQNLAADTTLSSNVGNWFNGLLSANDYEIYPYDGFVIRNSSASVISLVHEGAVPVADSYVAIQKYVASGTQDTVFSLMNPADENISTILFNSAVDGDQIFEFDNDASGINKAPSATYSYSGGTWLSGLLPANFEFEGGKSYVYRRASAAPAGAQNTQDQQDYVPSL